MAGARPGDDRIDNVYSWVPAEKVCERENSITCKKMGWRTLHLCIRGVVAALRDMQQFRAGAAATPRRQCRRKREPVSD